MSGTVLMGQFMDHLIQPLGVVVSLRRRSRFLPRHPASQMFKDSSNDVGIIDQRDHPHAAATLRALKWIDFIDLNRETRTSRAWKNC